MYYGDKREAKTNIMAELVNRGWKVFGYTPDRSDSMTDYYAPAHWDGIATKNGFVLVIDNSGTYYSGYEVKQYNYNSKAYKATDRITKLEAMMNDSASTPSEKANCAALIQKEIEKQNIAPKYTVIETYPTFSHGNPDNCSWHVEKDGQILGKGTGVFACYESNDHIQENRIKRDKKISNLINRIEAVVNSADAFEMQTIKVPVTVTKMVESNVASITLDDIKEGFMFVMKVSYTGGNGKGTKYAFAYKSKTVDGYNVFGKVGKRGKASTSYDKQWSLSVSRINELLSKGHIAIIESQEVTEYVEKTVMTKTARKQKVSDSIQLETSEDFSQAEQAQEEPQTAQADNSSTPSEQATKRQLWALHVATKLNTTNLVISKAQASELISKSKAGHSITVEVEALLNAQKADNSQPATEQHETAQESTNDVVEAPAVEYTHVQLEAMADDLIDYTANLMFDLMTATAKRPETEEEIQEFKNKVSEYMNVKSYPIHAITAHVRTFYANCLILLNALESLSASDSSNDSDYATEQTEKVQEPITMNEESYKTEPIIINGKVIIKNITFEWSESNVIEDNSTFNTFKEAEDRIRLAASKVNEGYDKTKFIITWTDGETYTGRIDIEKEHEAINAPIKNHITDWLLFLTGDSKPSHMTDKQYHDVLEMYDIKDEEKKEYYNFLKNYALTDIEVDRSEAKEDTQINYNSDTTEEQHDNVIYHDFNYQNNNEEENVMINDTEIVNTYVTFDDILSKFDNIEVTADSKISADDIDFCQDQQRQFNTAIELIINLANQIKVVSGMDVLKKEWHQEKSTNSYLDSYKLKGMKEIADDIKDKFISSIDNYFSKKYNITIDSIVIKKKYSYYVTYENVIDEIMIQLGGFSFTEKAEKEIKDKLKDNFDSRWSKVNVKNNKVTITDYVWWDNYSWSGKRIGYNDSKITPMFNALSLYDNNSTEMIYELQQVYNELKEGEQKYDIFSKYEFENLKKVKSFKVFKNGKIEIEFSSYEQAKRFVNEYCGVSNVA